MTSVWRVSDRPHPGPLPKWERENEEKLMHVVEMTKLLIGVLFAVIGIGMFVVFRSERGFGQRKQAGALFLVAAGVFVAVGLGYLEF